MLFSSVLIPIVSCNQVPSKAVTSALSRGDLWVVGGFLFTTPPHLIIWAFCFGIFPAGGFLSWWVKAQGGIPLIVFWPNRVGPTPQFLALSSNVAFPSHSHPENTFTESLVCLYFRLDKTDGSEVFLGSSPFPCFLLRRANRPKIVSFSDQK